MNILDDKLCKILLDKDNILPDIPESTDEDYHVANACKEFLKLVNKLPRDAVEIV